MASSAFSARSRRRLQQVLLVGLAPAAPSPAASGNKIPKKPKKNAKEEEEDDIIILKDTDEGDLLDDLELPADVNGSMLEADEDDEMDALAEAALSDVTPAQRGRANSNTPKTESALVEQLANKETDVRKAAADGLFALCEVPQHFLGPIWPFLTAGLLIAGLSRWRLEQGEEAAALLDKAAEMMGSRRTAKQAAEALEALSAAPPGWAEPMNKVGASAPKGKTHLREQPSQSRFVLAPG